MSVAEILHQIEALPSEERLLLVDQLVQLAETERGDSTDLAEALRKRPTLSAELGEAVKRMEAGQSVNLEQAKALHRDLEKLGL